MCVHVYANGKMSCSDDITVEQREEMRIRIANLISPEDLKFIETSFPDEHERKNVICAVQQQLLYDWAMEQRKS